MTATELRIIAHKIGKERLAKMLRWTIRTLDRKISGQHKITEADEVAIRSAQLAAWMVEGIQS